MSFRPTLRSSVIAAQREPAPSAPCTRRRLLCGAALGSAALAAGCLPQGDSSGALEAVWGRRGYSPGLLQKPRARAIDDRDELYIVDMTGRIQVFTAAGEYLRGWRIPAIEHGKPTGLSFDREWRLMVADTHYFRVLFYTRAGKLLGDRTIGGTHGHGPGQFGFVTDAVQDAQGNYYISEYGEYDRIHVYSPQGAYLFEFGGHGEAVGKFIRPQNLAIDGDDVVWVADACNHRIQAFRVNVAHRRAELVTHFGSAGRDAGNLYYPYDLAFDARGHILVSEFGNCRIQKFTRNGESRGCFGRHGRREGELNQPWALVIDSRGRLHVLDTMNHRVQRIRM